MKLSAGLLSIILAVCSLLCTIAALVCLGLLVFKDSDGDTVAAPASSSVDAPVIVTVTQGAGDNGVPEPTTDQDLQSSNTTDYSGDPRDIFINPDGTRIVVLDLSKGGTGQARVESDGRTLSAWNVTWELNSEDGYNNYYIVFGDNITVGNDSYLRAIPYGARMGGYIEGSTMIIDYHNEPLKLTCNGDAEQLSCVTYRG